MVHFTLWHCHKLFGSNTQTYSNHRIVNKLAFFMVLLYNCYNCFWFSSYSKHLATLVQTTMGHGCLHDPKSDTTKFIYWRWIATGTSTQFINHSIYYHRARSLKKMSILLCHSVWARPSNQHLYSTYSSYKKHGTCITMDYQNLPHPP